MPDHLKNEAHLVLQYGHDLPIPIPDLQIDEQGVSATLSFARSPWSTVVPWSAVYVVTSQDGRGVLYQEDVPGDVSVIPGGEAPVGDAAAGPSEQAEFPMMAGAPPRQPTHTPTRVLRAVPMAGPMEDAGMGLGLMNEAGDDELLPARRRKRPQLRLVK